MTHPKILPTIMRKDLPGDEEVLTSPDGANALIVNATGAAIVDLCDGTRTVDDIAGFVTDIVPGSELTTVRRDVQQFVGEFRTAGLLEDA